MGNRRRPKIRCHDPGAFPVHPDFRGAEQRLKIGRGVRASQTSIGSGISLNDEALISFLLAPCSSCPVARRLQANRYPIVHLIQIKLERSEKGWPPPPTDGALSQPPTSPATRRTNGMHRVVRRFFGNRENRGLLARLSDGGRGGARAPPRPASIEPPFRSVLLAFRHLAPRGADGREDRRIEPECLVHVGNDLH